ncbi:hypothetical protein CTEN210_08572 [Chaetoceros tenuissimus]|uniref:O-fucosyltransferase family protein n=1 Tax=Chaetoceros tenuissimus TaxID=426638 RepID=A0AAD3H6J1_9STRA|nr:hypothetical protein CTEN210_08572 [Chaetoceros tenuissimus]
MTLMKKTVTAIIVIAVVASSIVCPIFSSKLVNFSHEEHVVVSTSNTFNANTSDRLSEEICSRNVNGSASMEYLQHDVYETQQGRPEILIGYDNFNHVQTNNHLNAIFHAIDYANDHGSGLVLYRHGWAVRVLRLLFGGRSNNTQTWEKGIERQLGIRITSSRHRGLRKSGDEMYYYHTQQSLDALSRKRNSMWRYLWSNLTSPTGKLYEKEEDMCKSIKSVSPSRTYVVIHSRWMKNDGCLRRLGSLAQRIKNNTNIQIDRKEPCKLSPSYIEKILRKSNSLHYPIYFISDGRNLNVVEKLKKDRIYGPNVHQINQSFVGADMTLGVLSTVFIGTPISTVSGNIARSRLALGRNPNTNFLFPLKNNVSDFAFQDDTSLYNHHIMGNYAG